MNHRLLIRVTAPAVIVGLLLFAACLASIRYIDRLQTNLANILAESVTSLQAAQELEIRVRQLRFHSMLYLMDPKRTRLEPIQEDHRRFEEALGVAQQSARTADELACVRAIETGYDRYQKEQARLRSDIDRGKHQGDFPGLADSHPIRLVVDPCQELLRIDRVRMDRTAEECRRVSHEGHLAMLVLGLAGPVGGLVMGYGVARGLRRSIYRLSVRVQDMAERLDQKVASVSVAADGDIQALDLQMQHIIDKLEEVAARLQQQQRELIRAEQLSTMGQLAAGLAHEVRNPLTAIKMLVEAALRSQKPRPLDTEDAQMIHRETARLERTLQGFLDFARMPAPERTRCDLRDVLEQARELVRIRARQQHVELAVHCPTEPAQTSADRGLLGTVFVNLFLNALDAMPAGGRLDVTLAPASNGTFRLTVSDTGSGIPKEVGDRLFTPFATTKADGTGLGLSISARIIEEHGGTITAHNRPEGGACFIVNLPALPVEDRHRANAADR